MIFIYWDYHVQNPFKSVCRKIFGVFKDINKRAICVTRSCSINVGFFVGFERFKTSTVFIDKGEGSAADNEVYDEEKSDFHERLGGF